MLEMSEVWTVHRDGLHACSRAGLGEGLFIQLIAKSLGRCYLYNLLQSLEIHQEPKILHM